MMFMSLKSGIEFLNLGVLKGRMIDVNTMHES